MELKLLNRVSTSRSYKCLNRTFYGIETRTSATSACQPRVLIVPFMELKPLNTKIKEILAHVLIVPFMELKLRLLRATQIIRES